MIHCASTTAGAKAATTLRTRTAMTREHTDRLALLATMLKGLLQVVQCGSMKSGYQVPPCPVKGGAAHGDACGPEQRSRISIDSAARPVGDSTDRPSATGTVAAEAHLDPARGGPFAEPGRLGVPSWPRPRPRGDRRGCVGRPTPGPGAAPRRPAGRDRWTFCCRDAPPSGRRFSMKRARGARGRGVPARPPRPGRRSGARTTRRRRRAGPGRPNCRRRSDPARGGPLRGPRRQSGPGSPVRPSVSVRGADRPERGRIRPRVPPAPPTAGRSTGIGSGREDPDSDRSRPWERTARSIR